MTDRVVGDVDARGRDRVQTEFTEPSLTVQSDAHLADITNILQSYGAAGIEQLNETALEFKDVSEFTDLADAMNQAKEAEIQFLKLPSKVRGIFNHDVAVWLDTAHDKEKRDALVEAGFLKREEVVSEGGQGGDPGAVGEEVTGGEAEPS